MNAMHISINSVSNSNIHPYLWHLHYLRLYLKLIKTLFPVTLSVSSTTGVSLSKNQKRELVAYSVRFNAQPICSLYNSLILATYFHPLSTNCNDVKKTSQNVVIKH